MACQLADGTSSEPSCAEGWVWGTAEEEGVEWGISVACCPVLGLCYPISAMGLSSSDMLSSL